jgi:hypothetical protein
MGYRSEVYLFVDAKIINSFIAKLEEAKRGWELFFDEEEELREVEGKDFLFSGSHLKWYPTYDDIALVEGWMNSMDLNKLGEYYRFGRMGEEYGDYEERGESEKYYFSCNQSMFIEKCQ